MPNGSCMYTYMILSPTSSRIFVAIQTRRKHLESNGDKDTCTGLEYKHPTIESYPVIEQWDAWQYGDQKGERKKKMCLNRALLWIFTENIVYRYPFWDCPYQDLCPYFEVLPLPLFELVCLGAFIFWGVVITCFRIICLLVWSVMCGSDSLVGNLLVLFSIL